MPDPLMHTGTLADIPSEKRACPHCGTDAAKIVFEDLPNLANPITVGRLYHLTCPSGHRWQWGHQSLPPLR